VVGFNGEQSKALAGVANMIADAQTAKYGRDPTDQQRVSKRPDPNLNGTRPTALKVEVKRGT
jgi:hypothetical protein